MHSIKYFNFHNSYMLRPPLPPGNAPGTHFCKRLSRPHGHSAIGGILCHWKIPMTTSWDRTSDLSVCNTATKPLCHRGNFGGTTWFLNVALSLYFLPDISQSPKRTLGFLSVLQSRFGRRFYRPCSDSIWLPNDVVTRPRCDTSEEITIITTRPTVLFSAIKISTVGSSNVSPDHWSCI